MLIIKPTRLKMLSVYDRATWTMYIRGGKILKKMSAALRRAFVTVYGYPTHALKIWAGPVGPRPNARPRPVKGLALRAATPKSGQIDLGKKFY